MTSAADSLRRATPGRQVLADGTYEAIRGMILDHHIAPGSHVGIDWITRELGVSQTPVREALARLESDGLVEKIALRGYQTTPLLTSEELEQLHEFRLLMEPWMAAEAAMHATEEQTMALAAEVLLAEQDSPDDVIDAWAEFRDHDTRFHGIVARMSGNAFVTEAFERTHCHWNMARAVQASLKTSREALERGEAGTGFLDAYPLGARTHALVEHRSILDAIAARDSTAARRAMTSHVESSRERFRRALAPVTA